MRQFLTLAIVIGLLSATTYGRLQPLVSGNYVTSLNWSTNGLLLAYGTGQITNPWDENDTGEGIARVVEADGTIIFENKYLFSTGNVEVNFSGTMVFVSPYSEVFDLTTQQLVVGQSDGIAFNDGTWHPTLDILLLTEVLGARTYNPLTKDSTSILGRTRLPITDPSVMRTVVSVWSPNGQSAATTTTLGDIYIWDTTVEVSTLISTFSGHTRSVSNLDWNSTTNLIVSGDASGRILVWNPTTGQIVRELVGHTDAILDLDWREDGMQLVSTSLDNTMRVWDWQSGDMQLIESDTLISSVAYSPDGTELAYAGEVTDPNNISIEIIPIEALIPPLP